MSIIAECERKITTLCKHAWDSEVQWVQVQRWLENFKGEVLSADEECQYAMFALTKFMYFGKRLVREMLRSLYRDHFKAPLMQRIRRNLGDTRDLSLVSSLYAQELAATRFIGVGNPSESGTHLLYYFRQVNRLPKDLFDDIGSALSFRSDRNGEVSFFPSNPQVTRLVFFDDLVGSGTQASQYLSRYLRGIRAGCSNVELRYVCLFGTEKGMSVVNGADMFDGKATSMFDLDESYRGLEVNSRHFDDPPDWFDLPTLKRIFHHYGSRLKPGFPLGYKNGQLFLGFSHNTPDNAPPIFWDEGLGAPWSPLFVRYDKNYGSSI